MSWWRRKQREQDLEREIRSHLDLEAEEQRENGFPPDDAPYAARRAFGNPTRVKEQVRDLHPFHILESIGRDLRYAARQLSQAPAFAVAILLTLAIAMAANTAMFSVVRAVLLQPLPYPEPSRLVCIWYGGSEHNSWYTFSYPRFQYFQQHLHEQVELAAYDDEIITVSVKGEPVRLEGGRVSANFFPLLGVKPAIGRLFRPEEDRHGANPVVLLSSRLWKQRYAGDPAIIGRALRIDNEEFTIIGVLPVGFQFLGAPIDVWRSRIVDTRTFAPTSVRLGARYLTVVARLRPGVSLPQLRAKLAVTGEQYSKDNASNSDILGTISAAPLQQKVFGAVRMTLIVLWGAVLCLLVIAGANVANLILTRSIARAREINVRLALGASWFRVAQQFLTETVFLSVCSVLLSLPLARLGMRALLAAFRQMSSSIPDVHLDYNLLLFTFVIATVMGLTMGAIPIALLRQRGAQPGIRTQERSYTSSRWSVQTRNAMVAMQIALSVMLLAATGLLAKSLLQLRTLSSGLRTDQVAVFPLDLMPDKYNSWVRRVGFYQEVLRRVETVGNIRGAAIADRIDWVGSGLGYQIQVEGAPDLGSRNPGARGRSVSLNYFRLLGVPLLRGRVFNEHDTSQSQRVLIINEAFAEKFFTGVNPIGKHVNYSTDRIGCEVVGVVGNVRSGVQDLGFDEQIYLPLAQRPWLVAKLLIRTATPEGIAAAIRQRIRSVDPEQAVAEVKPLEDIVSHQWEGPRTTTVVAAFFASSALFLVAVGVYGVVAYSVAQRRREIGIRMALGADARRVRALVFRQTFQMLAVGWLVGLPGSLLFGRLYSSLLFATTPGDPAALTVTSLVIGGVALAATYLPAARATRLDATSVLRTD